MTELLELLTDCVAVEIKAAKKLAELHGTREAWETYVCLERASYDVSAALSWARLQDARS